MRDPPKVQCLGYFDWALSSVISRATIRPHSAAAASLSSYKDLKKKKRGNGTLCRGLKLVLKEGRTTKIKNWDGHKVHTVSIDDCDHMLCEHWPRDKDKPPRYFCLHEIKESVIAQYPFMGKQTTLGNINITQFGVNSNIATTGHKLQGMSKDNIIVTSWNYRFKNWIYLVLSRVRTRSGLFLLQKLAEDQDYSVDPKLIAEEERLKKIEEEVLEQREEGRKKRQAILESLLLADNKVKDNLCHCRLPQTEQKKQCCNLPLIPASSPSTCRHVKKHRSLQ